MGVRWEFIIRSLVCDICNCEFLEDTEINLAAISSHSEIHGLYRAIILQAAIIQKVVILLCGLKKNVVILQVVVPQQVSFFLF